MADYRGKTALITGSGSGIGRALAQRLAAAGARLLLADLDGPAVESLASELVLAGARAQPHRLDVTDAGAVEEVVADAFDQGPGIDLLINNAGICLAGDARDLSVADWGRVLDVNLRGVVHGVAAAYPRMAARGSGQIVNMASLVGLVPTPAVLPYTTSKYAVVGLSTALRIEAARFGVGVSVVCPSAIETGLLDRMSLVGLDRERFQSALGFGRIPVESCVDAVLRGVAKNRAVIPIGMQTQVLWRLQRFFPGVVQAIMGWQARRLERVRAGGS